MRRKELITLMHKASSCLFCLLPRCPFIVVLKSQGSALYQRSRAAYRHFPVSRWGEMIRQRFSATITETRSSQQLAGIWAQGGFFFLLRALMKPPLLALHSFEKRVMIMKYVGLTLPDNGMLKYERISFLTTCKAAMFMLDSEKIHGIRINIWIWNNIMGTFRIAFTFLILSFAFLVPIVHPQPQEMNVYVIHCSQFRPQYLNHAC